MFYLCFHCRLPMEYLTRKPGIVRRIAAPCDLSGAGSGVKIVCVLVTHLRAKVEMRI